MARRSTRSRSPHCAAAGAGRRAECDSPVLCRGGAAGLARLSTSRSGVVFLHRRPPPQPPFLKRRGLNAPMGTVRGRPCSPPSPAPSAFFSAYSSRCCCSRRLTSPIPPSRRSCLTHPRRCCFPPHGGGAAGSVGKELGGEEG